MALGHPRAGLFQFLKREQPALLGDMPMFHSFRHRHAPVQWNSCLWSLWIKTVTSHVCHFWKFAKYCYGVLFFNVPWHANSDSCSHMKFRNPKMRVHTPTSIQIIHWNRLFHELNHPAINGVPLDFGNLLMFPRFSLDPLSFQVTWVAQNTSSFCYNGYPPVDSHSYGLWMIYQT